MKPFLTLSALAMLSSAAPASDLAPLMAVPDKAVLEHDFSSPDQLTKETWGARQGTRWSIEDGLLRGLPSTAEYQAKKPDHKGLEPRVSSPATPAQFVAKFSVRFTDGKETAIVPFVEFGHHVARVKFSETGIHILGDHDSLKLAETTDLKYEPGKWYHCLAEMKGEEFVIQFADGPTLYARHPSYALPPPSGAPGMGVTGPMGGAAEIDNVTFWTIKEASQPGWVGKRDTFPKFEPVLVKAKK